ncbi:MAG TPA: histidine phosphatase family protein [Rhizomicrobium sp.]|nr:histidine phosphatase family protein [Rhizomicrobium sp.]
MNGHVTLYIARHGETEMNVAGRYPGYGTTPLTELGRRQARDIGRILLRTLGPRPAAVFVASPLLRAQVTMRLIREELALPADGFETDARLLDIDHGSWTGFTPDEMRLREPQNYRAHMADKWNLPMTGGESYAHLAARVRSFLAGVTADTVTVSHGATTQMLRGLATGMADALIPELDEPQGVVFRVRDKVSERLDPA